MMLTLTLLASINYTSTATACTVGSDNNCAGSAETDATSTQVRNRAGTRVGNPISLITGNKYQHETDYDLKGSRLAFHRHYNSRNTDFNFGHGNGWTATFNATLKRVNSTENDVPPSYHITQGNGRLLRFEHRLINDDGVEIVQGDRLSDGHLIEQGDRFLWVIPDGRRLTFYGSFLRRTFGSGVARGTTELTPLHNVTAQYENVDGVWQLVTMHPS